MWKQLRRIENKKLLKLIKKVAVDCRFVFFYSLNFSFFITTSRLLCKIFIYIMWYILLTMFVYGGFIIGFAFIFLYAFLIQKRSTTYKAVCLSQNKNGKKVYEIKMFRESCKIIDEMLLVKESKNKYNQEGGEVVSKGKGRYYFTSEIYKKNEFVSSEKFIVYWDLYEDPVLCNIFESIRNNFKLSSDSNCDFSYVLRKNLIPSDIDYYNCRNFGRAWQKKRVDRFLNMWRKLEVILASSKPQGHFCIEVVDKKVFGVEEKKPILLYKGRVKFLCIRHKVCLEELKDFLAIVILSLQKELEGKNLLGGNYQGLSKEDVLDKSLL